MKQINEIKKGITLLCQRCEHRWIYNGTNPYICSCPHCRTTVTVNKKHYDFKGEIK
jgi:hypothetical protein